MIRSSLRRLDVFVTCAECPTFAAAAERLNISQPSVSDHVSSLEKAVGGRLFHRKRGSKPVLTELGKNVLVHARQMLCEANDLQATALNIHTGGEVRVVLSCQRSLANFKLSPSLTKFALDHSSIQMSVRICRQEDVLTDVREGSADIGCFLSNDDHRGLDSLRIGRQRIHIIASPDHKLAGRKRIPPEEIAAEAFVGPPAESHFGQSINALLSGAGISGIRTVAIATEYQFLRELVAARVGLACSPDSSSEFDLNCGRLVALDVDIPPISMDIQLLTSTRRPRTPAMEMLSSFLISQLENSLHRNESGLSVSA